MYSITTNDPNSYQWNNNTHNSIRSNNNANYTDADGNKIEVFDFLLDLCLPQLEEKTNAAYRSYPFGFINGKYEYEGRIDTPLNFALRAKRTLRFVSKML